MKSQSPAKEIERAQLLAEQHWLEESLKKIKNHRNALQIERLQLESMLVNKRSPSKQNKKVEVICEPSTVASQSSENIEFNTRIDSPVEEFDILMDEDILMEDIENTCNDLKLDLAVDDHHTLYGGNNSLNSEEEQDVDDEEVDMRLFMNVPNARQSQDYSG